MAGFDPGKKRFFILLAGISVAVFIINILLVTGTDVKSKIRKIPIPGKQSGQDTPSDPDVSHRVYGVKGYRLTLFSDIQLPKLPSWYHDNEVFEEHASVNDQHPILDLMRDGDEAFRTYDEGRSKTFKETVTKYRRKYGRHPPPGFRDWYKFARDRNVYNVDDFDQIMDDLRPFWGIDPFEIRTLAGHMGEDEQSGVSGLHIRNKKIWRLTNQNWRVETMAKMVAPFIKYLPDMDIAMNRLDQPRVVVPWDDMQKLLEAERASRHIAPETAAEWTTDMTGLLKDNDTSAVIVDPEWFSKHGEQYMLIAKEACPPDSHARDANSNLSSSEALYKQPQGGFITNFNRSSDLCTIGPEIQGKHGFLFAPSTIIASKRLLPIFGECKVNVNSDILFPANMYYANDDRYRYDPKYDYDWDDKNDTMIWRGVTSGGTNTAENWRNMHRQRLVLASNGTEMAGKEVLIMTEDPNNQGSYVNFIHFQPSQFALDHTDVGFTEAFACVPDCSFYDGVWTFKNMTTLSQQFESKFVVDVDGHSFSGRWHAFLESKSLGIKSTIFREWHDSRLFAWRHFVPMDNRYDDLYSILTYFLGLGKRARLSDQPYMPRHDFEARKLGRQGREWAKKVLRKEDVEVSGSDVVCYVTC
jgi:hypothetical protein